KKRPIDLIMSLPHKDRFAVRNPAPTRTRGSRLLVRWGGSLYAVNWTLVGCGGDRPIREVGGLSLGQAGGGEAEQLAGQEGGGAGEAHPHHVQAGGGLAVPADLRPQRHVG